MSCYIGITCSWQEEKVSHFLSDYYVRAVSEAGGTPILIPTVDPRRAQSYYERVDGLLLSGGVDLDPFYFGEEPLAGLGEITPRRDALELSLTRLALEGNKPLLAICRGLQVLNAAAGGTLHQDLKGVTGFLHSQNAPRWYPTHQVDIEEKSRLYQIIGEKSLRVNSFHHQGINKLAPSLTAVAWSRDGLVEAAEAAEPSRHIIGVQWHPEGTWDRDRASFLLFKDLVEAAGVNNGK